jgi:hypothetical protein
MPTHRTSPENQQDPLRFKNLLTQAEDMLVEAGMRRPDALQLLASGQDLLRNGLFWRYQEDGLAVLFHPEQVRTYRLPLDLEELVVVGERFHLKPLLPLLSGDGRFYVLALSQNEVRLLQGTQYSVGQVDLEEVPESLAEALKWDDPESQLQWHTGTSAKTNGRAAIFHGHGVGELPDKKDQILRYFHQLDAGLSQILAGEQAPLILAAVEYLVPIYRDANTYPHLLEKAIPGNPEESSVQELHRQAWSIVAPGFTQERDNAARRYREMAGGELASADLEQVLGAAYQARVDTLFVALNTQRWGVFEPAPANGLQLHQQPQPGDQDLLDLAAVQCLLHGGTIYAVPQDQVPGGGDLAALFRF